MAKAVQFLETQRWKKEMSSIFLNFLNFPWKSSNYKNRNHIHRQIATAGCNCLLWGEEKLHVRWRLGTRAFTEDTADLFILYLGAEEHYKSCFFSRQMHTSFSIIRGIRRPLFLALNFGPWFWNVSILEERVNPRYPKNLSRRKI